MDDELYYGEHALMSMKLLLHQHDHHIHHKTTDLRYNPIITNPTVMITQIDNRMIISHKLLFTIHISICSIVTVSVAGQTIDSTTL